MFFVRDCCFVRVVKSSRFIYWQIAHSIIISSTCRNSRCWCLLFVYLFIDDVSRSKAFFVVTSAIAPNYTLRVNERAIKSRCCLSLFLSMELLDKSDFIELNSYDGIVIRDVIYWGWNSSLPALSELRVSRSSAYSRRRQQHHQSSLSRTRVAQRSRISTRRSG